MKFERIVQAQRHYSPLDAMHDFDAFECSEPLDRIAALRGLFTRNDDDQSQQLFSVDYGMSVDDNYTAFAMTRAQRGECELLFLSAVQRSQLLSGKSQSSLPSWVPDWRHPLRPLNVDFKVGTKNGSCHTEATFAGPRAIKVNVRIMDCIAVIPHCPDGHIEHYGAFLCETTCARLARGAMVNVPAVNDTSFGTSKTCRVQSGDAVCQFCPKESSRSNTFVLRQVPATPGATEQFSDLDYYSLICEAIFDTGAWYRERHNLRHGQEWKEIVLV